MHEEIKRWFAQGKEDLDTAVYLFEGGKYKQSSFYSQQTVEKVLKALLLKKTSTLIKIHDLVRLAKLVELDAKFMADCEKLTFVYIDARYPDTLSTSYSEEETKLDLDRARRILQWVEKKI